jgi:hypothetical protein
MRYSYTLLFLWSQREIELVRAGLASAHAERMVAGGKQIEFARVKISDAGWQALAGDAINGRTNSI